MKLDTAAIAALKEKYPQGIVAVETSLGTAVFKCPERAQWKKHLGMVADKSTLANGAEFLCLATVVHPDRETFGEWLDKKPGIPTKCVKKIHELAEADEDASGEE